MSIWNIIQYLAYHIECDENSHVKGKLRSIR